MTPDRWLQIEEIFHSALERDPHERSAFLDEACGGDESLRREVEILIASDEQIKEGEFLDPLVGTKKQVRASAEAGTSTLLPPSTEQNVSGSDQKSPQETAEFPVASWDRYHFIKLLGRGGMGSVYQGLDPRLNRFVALKFIKGGHPKLVKRFMQEAKAQARIEHEHVCDVYEVGEVEGKPYIAMQYVSGESVQIAGKQMSLEQKVKVVKEVAEALHAAHRLGIIHRDIKPANIMVERAEDGGWLARVMDFGLARDLETDQRLTEGGVIMGTPSFMSPEQAKGQFNSLDRRSDVYSLGATFYELLTGRPPFEGMTHFQTLAKAVNEEPVPVRRLVPNIPVDLQTIVMKCLEKDPQRRYDSARALSNDLQRYLDGEPIQARQPSWSYRIVKQAKRHRATVAITAVALLVVMVFGAVAIQSHYTASEQARLARQFGQEAERIEEIMQRAYLLPLHDTGQEQALVEERMDKIRTWMKEAGRIGEGAGHYVLGRGYLALHDYKQAQEYLELASKNGYPASEAAYPLGRVMVVLYEQKLEEVRITENKDLLEARKREIDKTYLEPALQYLNEYANSHMGRSGEVAYAEGQIAFYNGKYEAALKKAQEAFEQAPWLYEARMLQGEIYTRLGTEKNESGNYDEAMADYERAGEFYALALETGHSDASVYLREARRCTQVMELESLRGKPFKASFEQALAACDKALVADRKNGEVYGEKAIAYWRWGQNQIYHGEEPLAFEKAIEMAQQDIELNPRDLAAYIAMGNSYDKRGQYEIEHGLEPRASLERAIESYRKAVELSLNHVSIYNNLAIVYWRKGMYEMGLGLDPLGSLQRAFEIYKKAIDLKPDYAYLRSNLGNAYEIRGEYEVSRGRDPEPSLERAVESYKKAIELNPNFAFAYNNLGIAYKTEGRYEIWRGSDPRPSFEQAIKNFQKAIEINPDFAFTYCKMGEVYLMIGEFDMRQGLAPADSLNQARVALQKALRINPGSFEAYLRQGQVELIASRWAIHSGKSAEQSFKQAGAFIEQALVLNPRNADAYQAMAELRYRQAEWHTSRNQKVQDEIKQGLAMAEKGLAINSQKADAVAVQGALYLLEARSGHDTGSRLAAAGRAQADLEKALQLNPLLQLDYGPLLEEARQSSAH